MVTVQDGKRFYLYSTIKINDSFFDDAPIKMVITSFTLSNAPLFNGEQRASFICLSFLMFALSLPTHHRTNNFLASTTNRWNYTSIDCLLFTWPIQAIYTHCFSLSLRMLLLVFPLVSVLSTIILKQVWSQLPAQLQADRTQQTITVLTHNTRQNCTSARCLFELEHIGCL